MNFKKVVFLLLLVSNFVSRAWARNVRAFVNNPDANGTLHNNWSSWGSNNPPNCTTVDNNIANTSTSKFIYYQ